MSLLPTLTLLQAIKAALEPLKVTLGEAEIALFERVEFYGSDDLGQALQDLVAIKQRVALVIPAGDTFENEVKAMLTLTVMHTAVDVLIADRDWKKGQEADFGGAKNIGVVRMKDEVLKALTGAQFNLRGVALLPTDSTTLEISNPEKRDTPGRQAWLLSFETRAGDARASLKP